jgi:hypothetical protein
MRHIRKPVTLPGAKFEKLYIGCEAVEELAELLDVAAGSEDRHVPENLVRVLAQYLMAGFEDLKYTFED